MLFGFAVAGGALAQESRITIEPGAISLREGVYHLDARLDVALAPQVVEALDSGVPLTFELRIEVEQKRTWLWDRSVASLLQRFQLRYHALSQRYLLVNLNSGESRSFTARDSALAALGRIQALPLIDRDLLSEDGTYEVWLQARLDLDDLPRLLRTVAYLSPEWRLVSEWEIWRINV